MPNGDANQVRGQAQQCHTTQERIEGPSTPLSRMSVGAQNSISWLVRSDPLQTDNIVRLLQQMLAKRDQSGGVHAIRHVKLWAHNSCNAPI